MDSPFALLPAPSGSIDPGGGPHTSAPQHHPAQPASEGDGQPLSPSHFLLASHLASGYTLPEAAALAGVPLPEAHRALSDPLFLSHLRECLPSDEDTRLQFAALAPTAIRTIHSTLTSLEASERLKFQAARDLLDRAGFTPIRKVQVMSVRLTPTQHRTVSTTATELLED